MLELKLRDLLKRWSTLITWLLIAVELRGWASPDAKRLYEDKLRRGTYNKLIRPVSNLSDTLVVKIGLRLTQIIDVDEKNQIMTTNVWLEQRWYDTKLAWNPSDYGNVERLYVPSDEIWLPDIVLYHSVGWVLDTTNYCYMTVAITAIVGTQPGLHASADGNFTVKLMTKATIHYNGLVVWKPPAIYKSLCRIDVEFFPFDEQMCTLKIGSWSYDGYSVDIKHVGLSDDAKDFETITNGIDLGDYYKSTEWDLLAVPARKYQKFYPCCSEPYPDIKFNITIRRRTLFHTVNLIFPCVAICSVTLLVFYIPANSGEKITMGITILNSLNIFLLLVAEINPPTSFATPLIGKYLLFTMILVTCSIIVTVFVLNIHFRSPSTHVMSPWIQELFLNVLPRLLFMRRPRSCRDGLEVPTRFTVRTCQGIHIADIPDVTPMSNLKTVERGLDPSFHVSNVTPTSNTLLAEDSSPIRSIRSLRREAERPHSSHCDLKTRTELSSTKSNVQYDWKGRQLSHPVMQAVIGVNFIADHLKQQEKFNKVKQDWQFVAMVLDRLFLWMFTAACLVGTFGIIIQAPTLYDSRQPIPAGV